MDESVWQQFAREGGCTTLHGMDRESAIVSSCFGLLHEYQHIHFAVTKGVTEHGQPMVGASAKKPAANSVEWLRYFCTDRVQYFGDPGTWVCATHLDLHTDNTHGSGS